jgi:hypothetical protein
MSGVTRSGNFQNVRDKVAHNGGTLINAAKTTGKIALYSVVVGNVLPVCFRIHSAFVNSLQPRGSLLTEAGNLGADALWTGWNITKGMGTLSFHGMNVLSDRLLHCNVNLIEYCREGIKQRADDLVRYETQADLENLNTFIQHCGDLQAPFLDTLTKATEGVFNELAECMPSGKMLAIAAAMVTFVAICKLQPAYKAPVPPKTEQEILDLGIVLPTTIAQLTEAKTNWDLEISLPETAKELKESRSYDGPILEITGEGHILSALRMYPFKMQCQDGKTREFTNVVAATLAQKYSPEEMDIFQKMTAAEALSYAKARDGDESFVEKPCKDGNPRRFKNMVAATLAQKYSSTDEIDKFQGMTVKEALHHENISEGDEQWYSGHVKKQYQKDKKSRVVRDTESKKPLIKDVTVFPLSRCDVWLLNALSASFSQRPESKNALLHSEDYQLNHQSIGSETIAPLKAKGKVLWGQTITPNPSFSKINDLLHYVREDIANEEILSNVPNENVDLIKSLASKDAPFEMHCQDGKKRKFKNVVAAVLAQKYYKSPAVMGQFEKMTANEALDYNRKQESGFSRRNADEHWYNSYIKNGQAAQNQVANLSRCDIWLFNALSAHFSQHPDSLQALQNIKKRQLKHSLIAGNSFTKINDLLHYIRAESLKEPWRNEEISSDLLPGVLLNGPCANSASLADHSDVAPASSSPNAASISSGSRFSNIKSLLSKGISYPFIALKAIGNFDVSESLVRRFDSGASNNNSSGNGSANAGRGTKTSSSSPSKPKDDVDFGDVASDSKDVDIKEKIAIFEAAESKEDAKLSLKERLATLGEEPLRMEEDQDLGDQAPPPPVTQVTAIPNPGVLPASSGSSLSNVGSLLWKGITFPFTFNIPVGPFVRLLDSGAPSKKPSGNGSAVVTTNPINTQVNVTSEDKGKDEDKSTVSSSSSSSALAFTYPDSSSSSSGPSSIANDDNVKNVLTALDEPLIFEKENDLKNETPEPHTTQVNATSEDKGEEQEIVSPESEQPKLSEMPQISSNANENKGKEEEVIPPTKPKRKKEQEIITPESEKLNLSDN